MTVTGGQAYITQNGLTEKIYDDVRLTNGAVAKPDGTVVLNNGNTITLRTDQYMDLTGVLHDKRVRPAASGQRTTAPR